MQRQRRRDTAPELAVRRELHRRGLRYRVDTRPLPDWRRRADVVFNAARLAVFVDGCFWHGCPACAPADRQRSPWWRTKILRNRERDRETDERLRAGGWTVLRIWEHEPPGPAADRVERALRSARGSGGAPQPR